MRYVISIIILVCIAYLAVLFLGIVLPSDFDKTERRSYTIPIDTAWEYVTQVENYPQHREAYDAVREMSQKDGHLFQWQAFMMDGEIAVYQVNGFVKNKHFSYQLLKSSNDMTGNWNFYFSGDSIHCTIEITEQSRVENPIEKVFWYFFYQGERIDREFELLEGLEE